MALILAGGDGGNSTITGSTSNVTITNAQSLQLPSGNSDQRPSSPANGAIRYNTTTSSVEGYTAGAWGSIGGSSGGGPTWQNVITSNTTVSVGNAYPVDTTSSSITVTLPASPGAGNVIILTDYKQTFGVNPVTLVPNGSKIYGNTSNITLNYSGESVNLVYIDSTQGWIAYSGFTTSPIGTYTVSFLTVAGGGGGGSYNSGAGGGAGGLISTTAVLTPGVAYSITVGGGGSGGGAGAAPAATAGSNSSFGSYGTAIGGGQGASNGVGPANGGSGGSGGGGNYIGSGGPGTAGQGNAGGPGGSGPPNYPGGGGGGAGGVGSTGSGTTGGSGGSGALYGISGTPTYYAGGGGGSAQQSGGVGGTGGTGGGGPGAGYNGGNGNGTAGTTNTGGGGGAGSGSGTGASGGSGIVILSYLGSQRGTGGAVSNSGGYTIHTFTSSGTYTA